MLVLEVGEFDSVVVQSGSTFQVEVFELVFSKLGSKKNQHKYLQLATDCNTL